MADTEKSAPSPPIPGDVLLPSREEETLVVNPLGDPVFDEGMEPVAEENGDANGLVAGEPGEL